MDTPAEPPRGRVLVIDNDPDVRSDLQQMLEPLGYRVRAAEGVGRTLVGQAEALAREFRPHVAIVDLKLFDHHLTDQSGFELMARLQSARLVVYSSFLNAGVAREIQRKYGFAKWVVGKQESPEQLLRFVEEAARESCAARRGVSVNPGAWTTQQALEILFERSDLPPDLIDDVLGQLFADHKELKLETVGGEVVSAFPASRGRSIVLKIWPDNYQPVVAKLAPSEKIRAEAKNYNDYVRGRLLGMFHAQLDTSAEFWDLGGALYTFMGTEVTTLPSFATTYRNEARPEVIVEPLRHFFTLVWSWHYNHPLDDKPKNLFDLYDGALELRTRLEHFDNKEPKRAFPGLSAPIINPIPWVLHHADDSMIPTAREAITHGDLHGDNLFVDGKHAWAIDFERTGPGHILRDYAELEVDILTRLIPFSENELFPFYELAIVLAEPSAPAKELRPTPRLLATPELRKALDVVTEIRALARQVTRYSDFREYLWALLLDTVFVSTLAKPESPQRERALLLGGVLCGRLMCWNKEWPPQDWPPIARNEASTFAVALGARSDVAERKTGKPA